MSVKPAEKYRQFTPRCIDFHAHFMQQEVFAAGSPHSVFSNFGRNVMPPQLPSWWPKFFEPELQIEDMEKRGVDCHVISSSDVMQPRGWAVPSEEARLCAVVNDECARWVDRFPGRFIGTAVLPLGDMSLTMAELDRVATMKLPIISLPANYRGAYLGDARFSDLWSAVAERQLVTFLHPEGTTDPWFQNYAMWNSIGQSIEEVKLMTSLIYEGVMDRHPGVRIVIAHGGGYMPHYMGRLDRNAVEKPQTAKNIRKMPSEYLKDFYYDSCVYNARTLEILVERVGADRILLGGDYPVAELDPLDLLEQTDLDDRKRAAMAGGNVLQLLSLG